MSEFLLKGLNGIIDEDFLTCPAHSKGADSMSSIDDCKPTPYRLGPCDLTPCSGWPLILAFSVSLKFCLPVSPGLLD